MLYKQHIELLDILASESESGAQVEENFRTIVTD